MNEPANNLIRLHRPFDELRIKAELETAHRTGTRRPTWAPALTLSEELAGLCREADLLAPEDKPVARLWGTFNDPSRKGVVIRNSFSKHPLADVRCRGFQMYIGEERSPAERCVCAVMMDADGVWQINGTRWGHASLDHMRRAERSYLSYVGAWLRNLTPVPFHPPYNIEHLRGGDFSHRLEQYEQYNEDRRAKWEIGEQKKRNPVFIAEMEAAEEKNTKALEKIRRDIAKEEASPDWRYKARTRVTELAKARLFEFVGDPDGQRKAGSQVTGSCCCCGRELTDPISVERGIGPECVQHVRTFDLSNLANLKQEMVAAHPDKGGTHEAFLAAYAKYEAAMQAAENSLTY